MLGETESTSRYRPSFAVLMSICPVVFAAAAIMRIAKGGDEVLESILAGGIVIGGPITFAYAIHWWRKFERKKLPLVLAALFLTGTICGIWTVLTALLYVCLCRSGLL
jgi:hypothetical protein